MTRTFIVADDHPLFRGAIHEILIAFDGENEILEASDFTETDRLLADNPEADLLLLDLTMPGMSGLSGLALLRAEHPGVPIAVVSGSEDAAVIRRSLDLGASGFIPKSASLTEIREAIGKVLGGDIYVPDNISVGPEADPDVEDLIARLRSLTPQQTRVLTMISKGLLNKQIAYELGISEATIKAHVSAVLQKLGVDSRTQAVIRLAKISTDTDQPLNF